MSEMNDNNDILDDYIDADVEEVESLDIPDEVAEAIVADAMTDADGQTVPPQEVWFAKTSRTNLQKIYIDGQTHIQNPVCTEFAKRLQDGWRLHSMSLASNDMDVFVVLTRN